MADGVNPRSVGIIICFGTVARQNTMAEDAWRKPIHFTMARKEENWGKVLALKILSLPDPALPTTP